MGTRWGICSAGNISHGFVVALKTPSPEDHQVSPSAAQELKQMQEFADNHGIPSVYGRYKDLSVDPEIPADVVYVGAIHPHHLRVGQLFMNAGKNVLIEKPFALNAKEVKKLVTVASFQTAKEIFPLFLQALRTHFFVSVEVKELLSHGDVGEVRMVRADLVTPLTHIPRLVEKELGGGALLDIGVYCVQFVLMVYRGERPESIQATGYKLDAGVDGHAVIVLKFSCNRMAVCTCSISMMLTNDAVIVGNKGMIKVYIPVHIRCPITFEPSMPLNFTHSAELRYEAEEVHQCLLSGKTQQLGLSSLLAEITDEARRQVDVTCSQDGSLLFLNKMYINRIGLCSLLWNTSLQI
uniref:Trans-1,2-dihydrobenzene-1,2-diol dehydrogenase n=1 Tax=Pygocentrus nattereri TaxID=42514 RepID=A0AAR2JWU5_PYGNA